MADSSASTASKEGGRACAVPRRATLPALGHHQSLTCPQDDDDYRPSRLKTLLPTLPSQLGCQKYVN